MHLRCYRTSSGARIKIEIFNLTPIKINNVSKYMAICPVVAWEIKILKLIIICEKVNDHGELERIDVVILVQQN